MKTEMPKSHDFKLDTVNWLSTRTYLPPEMNKALTMRAQSLGISKAVLIYNLIADELNSKEVAHGK